MNTQSDSPESTSHNATSYGLKKVNGKGKLNTCCTPKSKTRRIEVGEATFVGKAAKRAAYLVGARNRWEARTQRGASGSSSCGDQKPGSIKCR